jgi:hypothetical protein
MLELPARRPTAVRSRPDAAREGPLVIPLSEHVDYWDHLGWRDPFSSKPFSQRQSVCRAHQASDEVYTPQMIVDGTRVFVGQDRGRLLTPSLKGGRAERPSCWAEGVP